MVKSKYDIVQWGPDRLRIGPWRGDPEIAYLAPMAGRAASPWFVEHCLAVASDRGYGRILTSALTVTEQQPFLEHGFDTQESLHLLRRDLLDADELRELEDHRRRDVHVRHAGLDAPPRRSRRGRALDVEGVLGVDARAFEPFWRFDREGLGDARRATPASRFRVVDAGHVAAYAITGRAGSQGYLQRLAVDPAHQRRGLGSLLVLDALRWARRRGATSMLVNTQESNSSAFRLYSALGFVAEEEGLAVLGCTIDTFRR